MQWSVSPPSHQISYITTYHSCNAVKWIIINNNNQRKVVSSSPRTSSHLETSGQPTTMVILAYQTNSTVWACRVLLIELTYLITFCHPASPKLPPLWLLPVNPLSTITCTVEEVASLLSTYKKKTAHMKSPTSQVQIQRTPLGAIMTQESWIYLPDSVEGCTHTVHSSTGRCQVNVGIPQNTHPGVIGNLASPVFGIPTQNTLSILEPPSKIRWGILVPCGAPFGEFGIPRRFGTNRIADLGVSHG